MNLTEAVDARVAISDSERRQRLTIVTEEYLSQGYIKNIDPRIKDGLYQDQYEEVSIPFVAKIGDEVVASLRLVPNTRDMGLSVLKEPEIFIYPEWRSTIETVPFEGSQLVKSRIYSRDYRPTLALFRAYVAYCTEIGIDQSVAIVHEPLIYLLNSARFGFNLPKIGPRVEYKGSGSVPVYIDIPQTIQSIKDAGNNNLADFLKTGKSPGYSWYIGS